MLRVMLTVLAALAVRPAPQDTPPERVVTGKVVDAAGQPVARALVGTSWGVSEDSILHIQNRVQAEADGSFLIKLRFFDRPMALVAMDAGQEDGGLIVLDKDTIDKPAAIAIGPLVNLHGTIGIKDVKSKPEWTNVYVFTLPGKVRFASFSSMEGVFSLNLPPGKYQLNAYGTDLMDRTIDLELDAAQRDHDLGRIEIELSIIAQHYGKAPPAWRVSDARGLPKEARLEDLKGKWVLIEFWGYW
jgi:hypothetical protein